MGRGGARAEEIRSIALQQASGGVDSSARGVSATFRSRVSKFRVWLTLNRIQ
jgi:hypothetical protein